MSSVFLMSLFKYAVSINKKEKNIHNISFKKNIENRMNVGKKMRPLRELIISLSNKMIIFLSVSVCSLLITLLLRDPTRADETQDPSLSPGGAAPTTPSTNPQDQGKDSFKIPKMATMRPLIFSEKLGRAIYQLEMKEPSSLTRFSFVDCKIANLEKMTIFDEGGNPSNSCEIIDGSPTRLGGLFSGEKELKWLPMDEKTLDLFFTSYKESIDGYNKARRILKIADVASSGSIALSATFLTLNLLVKKAKQIWKSKRGVGGEGIGLSGLGKSAQWTYIALGAVLITSAAFFSLDTFQYAMGENQDLTNNINTPPVNLDLLASGPYLYRSYRTIKNSIALAFYRASQAESK